MILWGNNATLKAGSATEFSGKHDFYPHFFVKKIDCISKWHGLSLVWSFWVRAGHDRGGTQKIVAGLKFSAENSVAETGPGFGNN